MHAHNALTAALDEFDVVSAQLREGVSRDRTTRFYSLLRARDLGNRDKGQAATVIELNNGRVVVTWLHDPVSLALYSSILSVRQALCEDGVYLLSLVDESDRKMIRGELRTQSVRFSELEKQILVEMGHGLGNKEIAEKIGASVSGVKNTLVRTYRKLGVSSRTEAALRVRDMAHLLEPGEYLPDTQPAAPEIVEAPKRQATVTSVRRRKDLTDPEANWRPQGARREF